MHKIYNGYCAIERFLNTIATVLIIAMMVIVVADVAGLFAANKPFPAAQELTVFLMVAIVYGALAYTQFIKAHISIELLGGRYSPRQKLIVETISFVIGLFFFAILTWQALRMTLDSWQIREIVFTAAYPLPMYPAKTTVFIGSLLICIRFIAQIAGNIEALLKGS